MENWDVVILGAGGAGLFCGARSAAQGKRTLLLEHSDVLGRKILISGGGRCNFTNTGASAKNYYSANEHFCKSAMARFLPADFIALVEKHRIPYHEKKLGQQFCDDSARRIVALLKSECEGAGAEIRMQQKNLKVEKIAHKADTDPEAIVAAQAKGAKNTARFKITTEKGEVFAHSVVVATGGLSIPKIGATDFGHKLARSFGLKVTDLAPALVSLDMDKDFREQFAAISGVAIEAKVEIGQQVFVENILFTHFGLSGPAILQASLHWHPGEKLRIHLLPAVKWEEELLRRKKANPRQEIIFLLNEFFPKSFVEAWLSSFAEKKTLQEWSDQDLRLLGQKLQRWELIPSGTGGYAKAEVTRGGVDTAELDSKSLEARRVPGLFFIGEVVDVTGWLGGYNYQWAWASAAAAAEYV